MSGQLDLSKPLDQEQIDYLLTKWPKERVQYWVEQANGSQFEEEDQQKEDQPSSKKK